MSHAVRRLALICGLLAVVLVPFLLFEDQIAVWLAAVFDAVRERPWLGAGVIVALLAGDCVLPVPSSLVSTFAGAAFGWALGALVIWIGMTLGCLAAYGLGASAGRVLAVRVVGEGDLQRARTWFADIGPTALVVTRAIPVLAEACAIAAGAARMPLLPFLAWTGAANIGVALVYAATGELARNANSFLLAFLALVTIPALGWTIWRLRASRRSS
jgi:uncharacterized membrane protein YdjX (TVP38/TMEM64 family)